jgi:DNA polymerase III subunit alpha
MEWIFGSKVSSDVFDDYCPADHDLPLVISTWRSSILSTREDFTHLHLHTQYSFLDGAIRMKDLVPRVAELGMKQVAVTDHGNMFGAVDFYKKATSAGIKPILGTEAYCTGVAGETKHTDRVRENFHLVLLAENNTGYHNLKQLSSKAFIDGKYYYPRMDKDLLYRHKEGIIALTACLGGEVGKKCAANDMDGAREAAKTFKEIFGKDNFFLEIQPNGIDIQNRVNERLAGLARDLDLRTTATNDCHYVTQDDHEAQNILMAIRQQKAWDDPTLHKHETDAFYIRSGEEMWDLLKSDYSEAFANSCEIGQRCNVEMDLGNVYLPPFPIPGENQDEPDYLRHLAHEGLRRRFQEITYPVEQDQYWDRMASELEVIVGMGFAGYFLIVQDFINWSKQNQIRVGPGRGSGAGSLIAYALRITDIDPIPYNLLFERFLNPERVSMPDFDVDFMQERRGEVIQYVADRYGRDHVGQIATYSGLNPKSAIKDVARTLGVPFAEINELTKPMPLLIDGKKPDFDTCLEHAPRLKELESSDDKFKKVVAVARTLEGLYRQAGMHAGGVVIGEKPLVEYVPLFSGQKGELITQFDKDKVEDAGLVKFDFLGLKTLDVIESAEQLVNARIERENELRKSGKITDDAWDKVVKKHPHCTPAGRGGCEEFKPGDPIPSVYVELLEPENKKVYKLIASGDTSGVFQVESQGFREMCIKLKPDCFEDIVAAVALYRPGPMQAGMVDDFIARKHGRKKVEYPHPLLEEILAPTYGTIVYQEQVMQSAQTLAGYSLGGADLLRRAMGKKKFEEMARQRKQFTDGAESKGIDPGQASLIFDTIEKFAGYGFNKSHSAAYALITYQTAYLKAHYPVEFMAALLTTESGSTDNIVKYIHEARTHGIEVLPPDVNISMQRFTVDYRVDDKTLNRRKHRHTAYGKIRFGLAAIKGLGDAAIDSILEIRQQDGNFEDLYQFCERMVHAKLNRRIVEVLTKSGGLDSFERPRSQIFATVDRAMDRAQSARKDKLSGQTNMFGLFTEPQTESQQDRIYADVPDWSEKETLGFERDSLGFYLSGHPLHRYVDEVKRMGAIPTVELLNSQHNSEAQVVGVVAGLRERLLKRGDGRWAVITLEDTYGQAEILAFSKVYAESESLLKSGEPLVIRGRALIDDINDEGQQLTPKMRAESVESLAEAQIARTRRLEIDLEFESHSPFEAHGDALFDPRVESHLPSDQAKDNSLAALESIRTACAEFPGEIPLYLNLTMPAGYKVEFACGSNHKIHPVDDLITSLERIRGITGVHRR